MTFLLSPFSRSRAALLFGRGCALAFVFLAGACSAPSDQPSIKTETETEPEPAPAVVEPEPNQVSILRPDIEPPQTPPSAKTAERLRVTIGFPDGGAALTPDAVSALQSVLGSDRVAAGFPITLRAHSDSAGSDAVNLQAARARGEMVALWLSDNGVDADRISLIVFGEQNPIEPNALPDGSPNATGRAANRRVEIEIPAILINVSSTDQSGESAAAAVKGSVQTGD